MRLGLIADIHGNAFALERVLTELDRERCDAIYCLGDLVAPGPWPVEVVTVLRERAIPCVLGNTDEWVLAAPVTSMSDRAETNDQLTWANATLEDRDLAFLRDLPMRRDIEVGSATLTLFHATPRSTTEVISALTPSDDLESMLGATCGRHTACGHTHVPLMRNTGSTTIINPGSIGLGGVGPGTPDLPPSVPASGADFAVLDVRTGRLDVSFNHLDLDIDAMVSAASRTGMPHLDSWIALWRR